MTKGAQVAVSARAGGACRPCQCACGPSPKVETMPTPVIQISRGGSAMGELLHGESNGGRGLLHVFAELLVRERNDTERDFSVACKLAVAPNLRLGACETRAVMGQRSADLQLLARVHESAQLRILESGKERHARKLGDTDDEPARGLRHDLEQQYPRHQRKSGEMAFEDRGRRGDGCLGPDGASVEIEVEDPIDQLKIFKTHTGPSFKRPLPRPVRRCAHTGCSRQNISRWSPCPRQL